MKDNGVSGILTMAAAGAVGWLVLTNLGPFLVLTALGGLGIYALNSMANRK